MNLMGIWAFTFKNLSRFGFILLLQACTNVFYQPSKRQFYGPDDYPVKIKPTDIYMTSRDGTKIHAWWFKQPDELAAKGTIIQFHGNAENMTTHVMSMLWILNHGYNLFTFDYRGYGKSEGIPYVEGVHADGVAAIAEALKLTPLHQPVYVVGQSLGGTIAMASVADFPKTDRLKSLIVEGTFYSYKQIAARKLRGVWFLWPFNWLGYLLVSNQESPKKALPRLPATMPLLVIHSKEDPVIPVEYGRLIYKKAKEPKCYWEIPERGHVGLTSKKPLEYRERFLNFLETNACP